MLPFGQFLSDQQVAAAALRPISVSAETTTLRWREPAAAFRARSGQRAALWRERRWLRTAAEAAELDVRGIQLVVLSVGEIGLAEVQ
jgi:hypothetical protein